MAWHVPGMYVHVNRSVQVFQESGNTVTVTNVTVSHCHGMRKRRWGGRWGSGEERRRRRGGEGERERRGGRRRPRLGSGSLLHRPSLPLPPTPKPTTTTCLPTTTHPPLPHHHHPACIVRLSSSFLLFSSERVTFSVCLLVLSWLSSFL